jgi:hypothetical protein
MLNKIFQVMVTGAVGVVDQIVKAPGVASCLSVNVLADAVTCASPLDLVPFRGTVPTTLEASSVARNLSPALRSAVCPADGAAPADAAQLGGAAAPVPAPLPPRKRGRPAKTRAAHAPIISQAPAGPKRSARVRDQGGHLFETVMARAVRLKAMKTGGGGDAASTSAPPPFRADELVTMAQACQLPDEDVRDLVSASAAPDAAP